MLYEDTEIIVAEIGTHKPLPFQHETVVMTKEDFEKARQQYEPLGYIFHVLHEGEIQSKQVLEVRGLLRDDR